MIGNELYTPRYGVFGTVLFIIFFDKSEMNLNEMLLFMFFFIALYAVMVSYLETFFSVMGEYTTSITTIQNQTTIYSTI